MKPDFKVLAVDFDGTLVEHDYPKIGNPQHFVVNFVKGMKEKGWKIVLWTCRDENGSLKEAVEYCKNTLGLEFDAVNENAPGLPFKITGPKIYADLYLDDRALSIRDLIVDAIKDDVVPVSKRDYDNLQRDANRFHHLSDAGVDNWEGYDDAFNDAINWEVENGLGGKSALEEEEDKKCKS